LHDAVDGKQDKKGEAANDERYDVIPETASASGQL
jgi:hypothetical protein